MKKCAVMLLCLLCAICCQAKIKQSGAYSFGVSISGHGKPMILIPGFKGSAYTYSEVVAHYKDRYKCYVITLAGFAGQPPSGVHDHLLQKQRDEIIRYIIANHLDKPVLVGFSFGGALGLWITCTRPDLVGPYIDIDGTPFDAALGDDHFNKDSLIKDHATKYLKLVDQTPAYWKRRDSIFHSPESLKKGDAQIKKLVSDSARIAETLVWDIASDFRSGALMDLEADTVDMRNSVATVKAPILVLGSWKSWDYKTLDDGVRDYGKQYAKAKNVTVAFSKNGRHFLMWEDFNWMVGEMDKFLAKYN